MTRATVVALLGMGFSSGQDATAQERVASAGPPKGSGSHDDLVALYREFRTFQQPAVVDGVADFGLVTPGSTSTS